ncbi:MAG: efflux transporter outer membrane subunit [Thermodesulfobacteriota bacterium]
MRTAIMRNKVSAVLISLAVLPLFVGFPGCAPVGPDFTPPAADAPPTWHSLLRQGLSQAASDPAELARWWRTLDDPLLVELIEDALRHNPDVREAMARLREARARSGVSAAALLPRLDASGSAARSKGSENSGSGATRSFYSVGFDAGWEIDIFGGARREVEAAAADIAASTEDLRDVQVTLAAEVGRNYLDVRIAQSRLAVAERNLVTRRQTFDLVKARQLAGINDELALQQARYNLESVESQLPVLRTALEAAKYRLAVLLGLAPGGLHERLAEVRPVPAVPARVAVGVPAETLRQRPDIRRAERVLAAQIARVGVATAELYPQLRLAGFIGLESLSSFDLFAAASRAWNIGPSLTWNIFDVGAIRRNIEVENARQEQALLVYEAAVLGALEEVENALTAFAEEQCRRERLVAAVDAARQAESLAALQYEAGLTDFSSVLEAQRALLGFEDQLAESNGAVSTGLIRLYKAMGGGWSATAGGSEQES